MPQIQREIVVQAPADNVYQVWRNFENFPSLMSNIEEVRETGYGRSHWKAKGPLGRDGEWDAEITRDEPGRAIAWRSIETPDANVVTSGSVMFDSLGDATRVCVSLEYTAPGGKIGETVTKIFSNPERQVEEDLARFKERIEVDGGYTRATHKVVGHGTPATEVNDVNMQDRGLKESGQFDDEAASKAADAARTPVKERGDAVKGKNPQPNLAPAEHEGDGMANEPHEGRPTTTGTPGGALGAPTEGDLKKDEEDLSERSDSRLA
jgi:hypothetical protein